MAETLLSVGLDVGTTTTQLIVSRLTAENRANGFSVPELEITGREILYRSPVHFTPLLGQELVDGEGLRQLVEREYEKAGIRRQDVDTGAVIITGETSRKENARTVLRALSQFAGDFVVATAGPDLESVLAAMGAGAVAFSEKTGKTVLHMDIGGGTSNLALIKNGNIVRTGCFNVGGRLIKAGYRSPVLAGVPDGQVIPALVRCLEMAAGLRPTGWEFETFHTKETAGKWQPPEENCVISFSGGVADCIENIYDPDVFGDMGPQLGQAIRKSLLCQGEYRLGEETVGATVIGAGCHSTKLSGSTVFCRNVEFPRQNLPVAVFTAAEQESEALISLIRQKCTMAETAPVLMFPGYGAATYRQVTRLAESVAAALPEGPVQVCLQGDMAKALGHALCLRLPENTPILCLDRVRLRQGDYLDVGAPVGPALPVVVKTLVLGS